MLPSISSEDCLFADLSVDPAVGGCQSYEATDFMLNGLIIGPSSQLVLWQIGVLGDWTYQRLPVRYAVDADAGAAIGSVLPYDACGHNL